MARILVAGGSGFIGTHMIRFLRLKGHYVVSADIEHPRWTAQEADVFIQSDLRRQDYAASVTKNIDWVFNFAADMGGMGFIGDPSLQASILYNNTMINFNLLEGARKNSVQKYFQASSVCVYPMEKLNVEHPIPLKESDVYPASPQGTYGWEKLQAEHLCQEYTVYGIQTHIARFHNVYGPLGTWRGGREKAPAAMSRKIALFKLKGMEVTIWGDGEATRSFMYVDDCVRAVYDLMLSDYGGPITLGPDRSISINGLVDITATIADVDVKKIYVDEGHQGVRGRAFDHSLCRGVIGWVPSTLVEEGMVETYNWVERQVEKAIEKGEL
jgi:GDP-D-mannose 3',5'-epimerase